MMEGRSSWGQRKRFSDGKVSVGYSQFLGFNKGEDGNLKVVPEQAETVRLIYKMFLEGKTTQGIANYLMVASSSFSPMRVNWISSKPTILPSLMRPGIRSLAAFLQPELFRR